jgi:hypothetical protein
MSVEIGTEAAQFPEKEYIIGIFVIMSTISYISPPPLRHPPLSFCDSYFINQRCYLARKGGGVFPILRCIFFVLYSGGGGGVSQLEMYILYFFCCILPLRRAWRGLRGSVERGCGVRGGRGRGGGTAPPRPGTAGSPPGCSGSRRTRPSRPRDTTSQHFLIVIL